MLSTVFFPVGIYSFIEFYRAGEQAKAKSYLDLSMIGGGLFILGRLTKKLY